MISLEILTVYVSPSTTSIANQSRSSGNSILAVIATPSAVKTPVVFTSAVKSSSSMRIVDGASSDVASSSSDSFSGI